MAYKVFISSTLRDLDLARDLAHRLESAGIKVNSVDKAAVSGAAIPIKITRELSRADEVFVILTDESVNSSKLMFEIGAASSLRKRITPVVVGLEPSKVPSLIKNLKYIRYPDLGRYIADLERRAKAA
jgi:predicted secreted protein